MRTFSVAAAVGGTAVAVGAGLSALCLGQRSILWPRPPVETRLPTTGQLIRLSPSHVALHFPPAQETSSTTLVYFHGNGDQLAWGAAAIGELLHRRGFGFVAVEYPGYGLAAGEISESAVMEASEALLRHLQVESSQVPRSSMLLLGQSIGCAVAIQMASRGFGRGLFLLSPFWSVHEMASVLFPPLRSIVSRAPFLIFDKLDNGLHVASLKTRTVIMHGSNDDVVPISHGRRLAEAFDPEASCRFIEIPRGSHNDLWEADHVEQVISAITDLARETLR